MQRGPFYFSVADAIRYGWDRLKRNIGLSLAIGVVGLGVMLLFSGLAQATEGVAGLTLGFSIGSQLVQILLGLVWVRFALSVDDPRPLGVRDLVPSARLFVDYLAVSVLYGLLVLAGLVLLVLPGVYLAVRYGLVGFVVVEGKADPLGAFRRSAALTGGAWWRLFFFGLVLALLNLLGAALAGLGLLITIPVSAFALAFVYRRLDERLEAEQAARAAPEPATA